MFIKREYLEKLEEVTASLLRINKALEKKSSFFENFFYSNIDEYINDRFSEEPEKEEVKPVILTAGTVEPSCSPTAEPDEKSGGNPAKDEAPRILYQTASEDTSNINLQRTNSEIDDSWIMSAKICYQETYRPNAGSRSEEVPEEIEEVLSKMDASFSDRLMELIREKHLDEVSVYKKADLDRRHFSKIRSNSDYHAKKDTVILLCMSMKLSYEESEDLLKRAGFAFSNSSKKDLIAQYFFKKKLYNVSLYKSVLYKYNLLKAD